MRHCEECGAAQATRDVAIYGGREWWQRFAFCLWIGASATCNGGEVRLCAALAMTRERKGFVEWREGNGKGGEAMTKGKKRAVCR